MINDMFCAYEGRREEVLVAYLYEDITPRSAYAFVAPHGMSGLPDRIDGSRRARGLATWGAPTSSARRRQGAAGRAQARRAAAGAVAGAPRRRADLGQAAAAMLVVAASLGLANINLTYSRDRAHGHDRLDAAATAAAAATTPTTRDRAAPAADPAPWRPEMTALEQQLRVQHETRPVDTRPAPTRTRCCGACAHCSRKASAGSSASWRCASPRSRATRRCSVRPICVKIDRSLGLIQNAPASRSCAPAAVEQPGAAGIGAAVADQLVEPNRRQAQVHMRRGAMWSTMVMLVAGGCGRRRSDARAEARPPSPRGPADAA